MYNTKRSIEIILEETSTKTSLLPLHKLISQINLTFYNNTNVV